MKMELPKFHNKKSLYFGVLAGFFLVISGMFHRCLPVGIIQQLIGFVLAIHCMDMVKIYKKHRIVKVVKSDKDRVIHKQD